MRTALRHLRWVAVVLLFVSVPFAAALVAIRYAPPAHVEIAGAPVSVKPVLGQDTSRIQGGALVRPEHAHVGLLGKNVGVDISADWNRLIPSDKQTRQYLEALWDDPKPEIHRIQRAARDYMIRWSLIGFLSGAVASGGVVVLLRERRRRLAAYSPEQAALVDAHNRRLRAGLAAAGTVGVLLLDTGGLATYLHHDHHVVTSNPVFSGTTLEGTEVNGLMAQVLPFLSILRPRDTFYDTVSHNLEAALADRTDLRPHGDTMTFVFGEDFEDVNGMARQVGLAAKLVDADFIALSGDLTFAGKPVESYIIDTVDYYSDKRPVYFAPGLHDTEAIVQAAKARDWHIADGRTQTVGGLTLLAAPDPRVSLIGDFGVGDVLRDADVDLTTFISNTIDEACATQPDFVLLHDHLLGQQIAAAGCQQVAVLDGRSYAFLGPRRVETTTGGHTYELTTGSAGGHVTTEANPGTIRNPARFAIITYSPHHQHTAYAVVTVFPDASVTVTRRAGLHVSYAELRTRAAAAGRHG
ncbi:MAG TPA: metallophosphoesterase [Nocardioides sp.]|nr:metallophosphoesterase [Nocardioides sp.]